jgi:hypothetical protein
MEDDAARIDAALAALEEGALDLAAFPHAEHVRLAYQMLARYPFAEALVRFSRGLKLLVAKAGKPEVYHETMTVAFLALIGERRLRSEAAGWSEFIAANPDLLDKGCLERWYTPDELQSEVARRTFLLPRVR